MLNPNYTESAEYIEIKIYKPLFGTFCYIRETWIKKSHSTNKSLKITIPQGIAIMTADQWMLGAKRMEKVFLRPDQPMVLFGNYAKLTDEIEQVKVKPEPLTLF